MPDQRRTDLSPSEPEATAISAGQNAGTRQSGFRQRLRLYAAGVLVAILALAWIDGGAEPLHPITQSVELKPHKSGAQ